jgi:hypothetical protein
VLERDRKRDRERKVEKKEKSKTETVREWEREREREREKDRGSGGRLTCVRCLWLPESELWSAGRDVPSVTICMSLSRLLTDAESISVDELSSVRCWLLLLLAPSPWLGYGDADLLLVLLAWYVWVWAACMPYFQLLRNPWKDTGDMRAVSALSAVKVGEGEQKVSPLNAAL